MKYKYVVVDFGKVLAVPPTGNWYLTPKFLELVGMDEIDQENFDDILKEHRQKLLDIIDVKTLDEEYEMFYKFYYNFLKDLKYQGDIENVSKEIAYDRVYSTTKYKLCDNLFNELDNLKNKYKLIMLTDNYPDIVDFLRETKVDEYFEKIYVSSLYAMTKKNIKFFEEVIKDFDIKPGEALFIDDVESNLDNAVKCGFDCLLMDRYCSNNKNSKYKIINNLENI
ncbi:MAG: HAD-IA family hydrolase [Bacilli bacterium]|nr:HAD-IA family hydrolase [Bacilli bacterium]